MKLRFKILAICLLASAGLAAVSCSNSEKEDENARIVNVEKGVAPAMATPEAAGLVNDDAPVPVGLPGSTEREVAENPEVQHEDVAEPASEAENKTAEE